MLRLISLSRLYRLHPSLCTSYFPVSNFTTATNTSDDVNTNTSRPSRKRKRKAPPADPQCQGLSQYRLSVLRRRTRDHFQSHQSLYNAAIDTMLISSLRSHPMHIVSPLITHAASLTPNAYQPSEHALLALLDATLSAASTRRLPYSPADISTEAFIRLTHAFHVRPTLPILEVVAEYAATDPVVERRSQRIWSVLREMRSLQLAPTPDFLFRCFETCVSALDVPAAVTIMEYALSKGLYHEDVSPRVIDFYNAVMYAALLRSQFKVVLAAKDELHRKKISTNSHTDALLLATYIDTADPLVRELRKRLERPFPAIVHAAEIRAAARHKTVSAVIATYQEFEEDLRESGRPFHETLSQPAVTTLPAYGALSEATSACARADPTMSAFQAFRACGAPVEAMKLLTKLKDSYGYQPSKIVYTTIIEGAWRTGKLELAQKIRLDMQTGARVNYTAGEIDDVGLVLGNTT